MRTRMWTRHTDVTQRPERASITPSTGAGHTPSTGVSHTPSAASRSSTRSGAYKYSTTSAPAPISPARSPSREVTTSR